MSENQCFSLKDLAVNGKDLINLGIPADEKMGKILNELLLAVINEEVKNEKQELIKYLNKLKG